MTVNTRDLLEERARLVGQARELLEDAEQENRDLNTEEQEKWDRLMDKASEIRSRVDRIEKQRNAEAQLEGRHTPGEPTKPEPNGHGPGEDRGSGPLGYLETEEYTRAFESFIVSGARSMPPEVIQELRALQADIDVSGGFALAPMQFVRELIKAVDDRVYIRQWATVRQVTEATSLGVASLDSDPADADWTAEIGSVSEDSDMAFGRRELEPHMLSKLLKVSRKFLRLDPDAQGLVRDRLAYKFGITWEKAALTGDGANEPLGIFTASNDGISTSRDVSTGNTATTIEFDGLKEAKYTLKGQYHPSARWLFHRDGVKQIAKLQDANNQYLWQPAVRAGEPETLLGLPVFMSEYVPNTFTTGLYVGALGDFSHYWAVDSLMFELQRLEEKYADTNEVGFIGRLESDGQPVLEEAFVRVTLA